MTSRIAIAALAALVPILAAVGGEAPDPPPTDVALDMEFRGTDLPTVLRLLCERAGVDFVLDPAVQGRVTATLRHTTWADALDAVLASRGLERRQMGKVVLLTARPAETAPARAGIKVVAREDGTLDLEAAGAEARDVIRQVAAAARLDVAVAGDIRSAVTAVLHAKPPRDALAVLAESCGAAVETRGDVLFVVRRERKTGEGSAEAVATVDRAARTP